MDEALLNVVLARLDRVPLEDVAAALLLAVCEGDAALAAELSGEERNGPERDAVRADAEPAGAYLRSITVSGFRGAGPAATLKLDPGLTVVIGRNGSNSWYRNCSPMPCRPPTTWDSWPLCGYGCCRTSGAC